MDQATRIELALPRWERGALPSRSAWMSMVRAAGIGPAAHAWKAWVLPLDDARKEEVPSPSRRGHLRCSHVPAQFSRRPSAAASRLRRPADPPMVGKVHFRKTKNPASVSGRGVRFFLLLRHHHLPRPALRFGGSYLGGLRVSEVRIELAACRQTQGRPPY